MAQMHEQMKRFSEMPDLDGIGDGLRPIAATKPAVP
jgi:hypothetical protein